MAILRLRVSTIGFRSYLPAEVTEEDQKVQMTEPSDFLFWRSRSITQLVYETFSGNTQRA